jgi:hypothetical protein
MGVPQGVPKEALRYKKTKRPPASARPWNIHPASAFKQHPSKELQNALSQANTAAHPYAEFVNTTNIKSQKTSQTTRCGVECGMGVPQGVPKEALRYKKTKRPPA